MTQTQTMPFVSARPSPNVVVAAKREVVAGGAAHDRDDGARHLVGAAGDLALVGGQAVAQQHERGVVALLAGAVARGLRRAAGDRGEVGVVALDVTDAEGQLTGDEMRGDAAGRDLRVAA